MSISIISAHSDGKSFEDRRCVVDLKVLVIVFDERREGVGAISDQGIPRISVFSVIKNTILLYSIFVIYVASTGAKIAPQPTALLRFWLFFKQIRCYNG